MKLHPYLTYGGNCAEAFRFYEQHLGGKITAIMTWGEMPEPRHVPPGYEKAVLHARMTIGETSPMGMDAPPEQFQPMQSVYLSLSVGSSEEAERIHGVLADGGQVLMPLQETFYAFRFSMLKDKFGTSWMIIHERPMPSGA